MSDEIEEEAGLLEEEEQSEIYPLAGESSEGDLPENLDDESEQPLSLGLVRMGSSFPLQMTIIPASDDNEIDCGMNADVEDQVTDNEMP